MSTRAEAPEDNPFGGDTTIAVYVQRQIDCTNISYNEKEWKVRERTLR